MSWFNGFEEELTPAIKTENEPPGGSGVTQSRQKKELIIQCMMLSRWDELNSGFSSVEALGKLCKGKDRPGGLGSNY